MAQISDRIPPLDRDGRSEMFWDTNLELFRSWTDPFWFCTKNGKYIYQCSTAGDGVFHMPHPRVWDYLVNGYGDDYRGGTEQIAFFAETGDVVTESFAEFMLLELWLSMKGYDMTMHTFPKGSAEADITATCGPSVKELGSQPKISFEPYEQAKFTFDTMHQSFMESAATMFNETERYQDEYYASSTNDPDNIELGGDRGYYDTNHSDEDHTTLIDFEGGAEHYPDDKDIIIETLRQRLRDEKEWFTNELNRYINSRQGIGPADPVWEARRMELDNGDMRNEEILALISQIEGEREFYDYEIERAVQEHQKQLDKEKEWDKENRLF